MVTWMVMALYRRNTLHIRLKKIVCLCARFLFCSFYSSLPLGTFARFDSER